MATRKVAIGFSMPGGDMAVPQELERYVRDALAAGMPRPQVEATLLGAGWGQAQVRAALAGYADIAGPVPVPRPRRLLSAREAFEYLLLFATLYLSAWHLGSLLFDLVDHVLPDPADPAYRLRRLGPSMRWSISALVVAFPLVAWLARRIGGDVAREPVRRLSPVRRWLTYLTLFVAASVLVGDLVALVYNVLGGEASLRFVLKVAVVGVIAGAVFGYYLSDLRRDETGGDGRGLGRGLVVAAAVAAVAAGACAIAGIGTPPARRRARRDEPGGDGRGLGRGLVVAAAVAAVAAVACAIAVIGTPPAQRQARLDERRVDDLRQLQAAIADHARREGRLPASLEPLADATG